jgi:hypothetical protein
MRGCIIVVTDTFWPVAIVIVATGAVDISITQNSSNTTGVPDIIIPMANMAWSHSY